MQFLHNQPGSNLTVSLDAQPAGRSSTMSWLTRSRERGPYLPSPSAEAQASAHRQLFARQAHADRDVLSLCHLEWGDPTTTPRAALPDLQSRLVPATAGPQLGRCRLRARGVGRAARGVRRPGAGREDDARTCPRRGASEWVGWRAAL